MLHRVFITSDHRHKRSIRFIVDLANIIRLDGWSGAEAVDARQPLHLVAF